MSMTCSKSFFDEVKYQAYLRTLVMSRRRIVFSLQFDRTASHLAAGNSAGHLNVFDLKAAARDFSAYPALGDQRIAAPRLSAPSLSVDTQSGSIYSIFSDNGLLYCGTDTGILVYRWSDLLDDSAQCAPVYRTTVQVMGSGAVSDEPIETNAITGMRESRFVYAATGHGSVDCFTADTLRFHQRYRGGGPGAYLHCISMRGECDENSFVTGGDDGVVRAYDARAGLDPVKMLDLRNVSSVRQRGWVSCIASDVDGSFIVCGAGNRSLTSIHLASGSVLGTTSLEYVPNAVVYRDGELYCGGANKLEQHDPNLFPEKGHVLYRYDLECFQTGVCPVSSSGVYALALDPLSNSMAAGGYSTRHQWHDAAELIDVYIKPPVRSFSMAASELAMGGD
jgi:WD40 repeat protein